MPTIQSSPSILTVSRQDFYDYQRCPRIVSIKVYRRTRAPPPVRRPEGEFKTVTALIGKIGEAATQLVFSPEAEDEEVESLGETFERGIPATALSRTHIVRALQSQIQQLPRNLEAEMRQVAGETFSGLAVIRQQVNDAYGRLKVIGKGESRQGSLPTTGHPDFVALSEKKPIMVEVKNGVRENPNQDNFQASFYNSLSETVGVIVQDFGAGDGVLESKPRMVLEQDAETLIVYPRLKTWRRVDRTIDLSPPVVQEIWRAKQLGIMGRWPEIDCSTDCPHQRFDVELPNGNLEVVKPLPLIFANGLLNGGVDFDYQYIRNHIWQISPSTSDALWKVEFERDKTNRAMMQKLRRAIQDRFGLNDAMVMKLVPEKAERMRYPHYDDILKEEASEIEPWTKLLPKKILSNLLPSAQGYAKRVYSIPRDSPRMIRKALQKWS